MLSLARSRHTLPAQTLFTTLNTAGVLAGVYYAANTPDLYPGDAHRKLGWLVTVLFGGHLLIGIVARAAGGLKREKFTRGAAGEFLLEGPSRAEEREGFMRVPVSAAAMAEHEARFFVERGTGGVYGRFSNDSGQGTELGTESLRSRSLEEGGQKEFRDGDGDRGEEEEDGHLEGRGVGFRKPGRANAAVVRVARMVSGRVYKALVFWYNFVDRTVLILGFVALCTGIISFARFFVSIWPASGWVGVEADE